MMTPICTLRSILCATLVTVSSLAAIADVRPLPEGKTKPCFQCQGAGKTPCPARCQDGEIECPAPCLKLTKGSWVSLEVPGYSANDRWQRFEKADGGWEAWNQTHVGQLIVMKNGNPVNAGPCPTCGGTTRAKCTACQGAGDLPCSLCNGQKIIPETWTTFDHPKMKNRPSRFKLKDGRVVLARKVMQIGSIATLRMEKGDLEVNVADIVSEEKQPAQN